MCQILPYTPHAPANGDSFASTSFFLFVFCDHICYFIFERILDALWTFILTKNLGNSGSKAACRGLTKIVRKNVRFWSLLNLEN